MYRPLGRPESGRLGGAVQSSCAYSGFPDPPGVGAPLGPRRTLRRPRWGLGRASARVPLARGRRSRPRWGRDEYTAGVAVREPTIGGARPRSARYSLRETRPSDRTGLEIPQGRRGTGDGGLFATGIHRKRALEAHAAGGCRRATAILPAPEVEGTSGPGSGLTQDHPARGGVAVGPRAAAFRPRWGARCEARGAPQLRGGSENRTTHMTLGTNQKAPGKARGP